MENIVSYNPRAKYNKYTLLCECGETFKAGSRRFKRCPECRKERNNRKARERGAKLRAEMKGQHIKKIIPEKVRVQVPSIKGVKRYVWVEKTKEA